jgi:hypothetical protein
LPALTGWLGVLLFGVKAPKEPKKWGKGVFSYAPTEEHPDGDSFEVDSGEW